MRAVTGLLGGTFARENKVSKGIWIRGILAGLVAVLLVACGGEQNAGGTQGAGESAMARIEGAVFYRERIMLPPGIRVAVQLEDISRADAMATVMATVEMTPEGGPPYPFAIDYDTARIDPRMRYALRATITRDDTLLFTNTDYIDPFSGNPVEVLVQAVPQTAKSSGPGLESGRWLLSTLRGQGAPMGAGDKPVDLQLLAEERTAAGFSGCNRYTGVYAMEGVSGHGTPLKFGNMAGTLMACATGGELERDYLQMLAEVDAYRLQGDTLSLLVGAEVVATLKPE